MKALKLLIFSIGMAFLFSSCGSSFKVSTDFDRTANFSGYKTFAIYKQGEAGQTISQLNEQRVYNSIRKIMLEKGFTESENPDIWVNAVKVVSIHEQHSSTTTGFQTGMGMGMGMGFHRPYMWGGPMMMTGTNVSRTQHHVDTYKKGTFLVDIIDAKTNNLVWHSNGNREIDKKFNKNPDDKILKYMRKLMKGFPPGGIVHIESR